MLPKTDAPARARRVEDGDAPKPIYAVWELTMKCDQPCQHCGSRAGRARSSELSTSEILDTGRRLAELGCREIALIGGEAYLRTDIEAIVAGLASHGMRVAMQTGGRAFTPERARALKKAGMVAVGVSIDGPAAIHDELRGNAGSHAAAIAALDAGREAGLIVSSNMQVNRLNADRIRETCDEIRAHGAIAWQVQLTVAMGRAADRPDWIIEPWRVVDVIDTLAAIQRESATELAAEIAAGTKPKTTMPFNIAVGNNIGYYGPHELTLRSRPGGTEQHWSGCQAGVNVIGIESDGTVKSCPSLPTGPYAGGNVLEMPLEEIWATSEEVRFARDRTVEELWGFCRSCYYAEICRGGCSWTAHCTLGKRGNNPFCYHRVIELKKKGIRERLVAKERAPNQPYDFGRLEIVEEPWDAEPAPARHARRLPIAG